MSAVAVDSIPPERILAAIGNYRMAFAESYKGHGNRDDGNFQDFNTSWRSEEMVGLKEIYLEMLRRNVASACAQGFNFMEFWGWPEVYVRDDLMRRVTSRIRILRVEMVHQPRAN